MTERVRVHRSGALLAGLVLLAGCASASPGSSTQSLAPTQVASPSASPLQSATPTPEVTASPSPTATPVPPLATLSLARVTVDSVNLRAAPSAGAALITDPNAHTPLGTDDRVLVLAGPMSGDGYLWYQVALEHDPSLSALDDTVGWIAAGTATDPWLEADTTPCPQPTVTDIAALPLIARFACYGSTSLTFDAHQAALPPDAGLGGACEAPDGTPDWMVCDNINHSWVNDDGGTSWLLLLHFDPATSIHPTGLAAVGTTGPALEITGHFNDPAAADCVTVADPTGNEGMSQWLTCATKFVVEALIPA